MPQDIKKPTALIQEEQTIRAKYTQPYDALTKMREAVDADYSQKVNIRESQKYSLQSEADIKKSSLYSEREALLQKREEEVKSAWPEYGWSQAKEDAFTKQQAVTKKTEAHITEETRKQQDVVDAIHALLPDPNLAFAKAVFNSKPSVRSVINLWEGANNENLINEIHQKDALSDKINVVVSQDAERIVSVTSKGVVNSYKTTAIHALTSEEKKSTAIKAVEHFIQSHTFKSLKDQRALEAFTDGINSELPEGKDKIVTVLLDDHKRVLLATDQGAFEVVNIQAAASTPLQSVGKVPAAQGVIKK